MAQAELRLHILLTAACVGERCEKYSNWFFQYFLSEKSVFKTYEDENNSPRPFKALLMSI